MERVTIKIGGMHCVRCSQTVTNALKNKEGILEVDVSYASEKALIKYDNEKISYKDICKIIKKKGYYVVNDNNRYKEYKKTLMMFVLSLFLTIPFMVMMVLMFVNKHDNIFHNGWFQLAFVIPIQFIVGYKFYKGAFDSLKNRSPNMDLLVALGTTVAFVYSLCNLILGTEGYYFESCAFVITLVYLGKLLEMKSKNKTNEALDALLKLRPSNVTILENDSTKEIDISELKENDLFIVRARETIATDGIIVKGSSSIDESMLTGESLPVYKEINSQVYGGTISVDGNMIVKVSKIGEFTALSKIIKMVEEAQSSKAKVQRFADKVSAWFVPLIILIALVCFFVNYLINEDLSSSISRAVAVLVIACPCSLGLATPTAIIVGMGKAAKKGILIKDADVLERVCDVKTIVMDKTGTITTGKINVEKVDLFNYDEKEFSDIVSKIEEYSNHPLAKSIVRYYGKRDIELEQVKEIAGKGIEAVYDSKSIKVGSYSYLSKYIKNDNEVDKMRVFVVIDDVLRGIIYLKDTIKTGSSNFIKKLKENNINVVLASGDSKDICEKVADSVGIEKVHYEVLPEEKYNIVNEYKSKGLVAMVGDGINDAPALVKADIGISMGSAIDVAVESGDVIIMNNDLINIYNTLLISRATMRKIKQNLFWAFFYNCVGVPLACVGVLSPIIAGICMSLSSVSVVTNSLLLNKIDI